MMRLIANNRIDLDTNQVERTIRLVVPGRNNALIAGSSSHP